jgi:hypothetical protein
VGSFKNLFQNHWARIGHIYMKTFWYSVDSELFTSWSLGSGGATIGKTIYTCVYIEKKIFSRTTRPFSVKLGINHPWVQGILNCSDKGAGPLQRGDNCKNGMGSFRNLLQNHWVRIGHVYMKACWYNVDSELFTSWSPEVGRGLNIENHIYIC